MLSIEDYNSKEVDGRIKLSNRFIRAFRPKLFENGGFPITVQKEEELVRYIDSMHAYSFESHYNDLCGGITEKEFSLKEGSVKKEVLLALKDLLVKGINSEKIYALGSHINSRLDSSQIFYCDDVGDRMNTAFEEISKVDKVDIERVKKYYDSFDAKNDSPDDEFAEYISCKKK